MLIMLFIASSQIAAHATQPKDILLNVMGKYIDVLHHTGKASFKPDPNHFIKEIKLYVNGKLTETFTFTDQKNVMSQRVKYDFPTVLKGDKLLVEATCNQGQSLKKEFIATYSRVKEDKDKKETEKEVAGVPSSWNGDYALENRPKVKALTIRGGKIYTVTGSSVVETFPGRSTLKYKTTYSETECKQTAGSTVEVKFTRDSSGKIKYFISGSVSTYIKIK
jgi:hypothetical protein